jgi:hypothetical protein
LNPLGALIGFGEVRHRRLRPVGNAFSYPTYFLMLPMRHLRAHGSDTLALNRPGLLSFHDRDHGDGRSAQSGGALAWLDALLQDAGIQDATGEAWLQTYPRVLGHTFKPVSFWYCHTPHGDLRAVVAEVNNTFGERHCYLLDQPAFGAELRADKVFHVSPFCSTDGQYRFRFMRSHNDGGEHIIARVDHDDMGSDRDQPQRYAATRHPASLRRACRYPALEAGVVARIHWQALRLWLKRVPFRHA